MSAAVVPLLRLRVELDDLLRRRAFFGRAVRGHLDASGYLDLVAQLAALACSAAPAPSGELLEAAARDLRALSGRVSARPQEPGPCAAVCLYSELLQVEPALEPELALDVAMGVMGTSWAHEAASGLDRCFRDATSFLRLVGERGARSVDALRSGLDWTCSRQQVYAFAELTRGAVLGLATYLDTTWPAPRLVARLSNN